MGGACSQTRCLPPAHCWGLDWTGVCGHLPFSPEQQSLWSEAGPCQNCLQTTRFVALPLMGSGECVLEGVGLQENQGKGRAYGTSKVPTGLLQDGTCNCQRPRQVKLEGADLPKPLRAEHLLSAAWTELAAAVLPPTGVLVSRLGSQGEKGCPPPPFFFLEKSLNHLCSSSICSQISK